MQYQHGFILRADLVNVQQPVSFDHGQCFHGVFLYSADNLIILKQQFPYGLAILRNDRGMPRALEALEPLGEACLEFGDRDDIIFDGNGFYGGSSLFRHI